MRNLNVEQLEKRLLLTTITDNFSGGINHDLWAPYLHGTGTRVAGLNDRVEIEIDSDAKDQHGAAVFFAGVESQCEIPTGVDYDTWYQYSVLTNPYPTGNGTRIGLNTETTATERISFGGTEFSGFPREAYLVDGSEGIKGVIATSDLTGYLRQQRIGNVVNSYRGSPGSWTLIYSETIDGISPAVRPKLVAWSHEELSWQGHDMHIAFDNFSLTANTISCPHVSDPGIDKWWATVGDESISVTWTVEITEEENYGIDIDISGSNWDLTTDASVYVDQAYRDSFSALGRANLGTLQVGTHQIRIDHFKVPSTGVVEEIEFKLTTGIATANQRLKTLFIADYPEVYEDKVFRFEDEANPLNLQQFIDKFSPTLHFSEGEKYFPVNVETLIAASGDKFYEQRNGDSEDYIDLSVFADHKQVPEDPTIYASVLECQASHANCTTSADLALNYWFFYARSNWSEVTPAGANTHEGDVEGITIFFSRNTAGEWVPEEVAVSQHDVVVGSRNVSDRRAWEDTWGSRLNIAVSLGGHASYLSAGTTWILTAREVPEPPFLEFVEFPDVHDSRAANGSLSNVYLTREINDHWSLYNGRLGNPDLDMNGSALPTRLGDRGPRNPRFGERLILDADFSINEVSYGERWLDPWSWIIGFDEYVDPENDGVSDDIENAAPNGGDGNSDGIPDSQQGAVASLRNAKTGNYVTLATSSGTFEKVAALPDPESLPSHLESPIGMFSYNITGLTDGEAMVTFTIHGGSAPNAFYKFGPIVPGGENTWYDFTFDSGRGTGAVFNDNGTVSVILKDGQLGDDDWTVNGVIIDPGAPVISEVLSEVTVTLRRGKLSIVGDGRDNSVLVTQVGTNSFQVTGRNGTAINGEIGSFVFTGAVRKMTAVLNDGNDTLDMFGIENRHIFVGLLGRGDDSLSIQNSTLYRLNHIDTGIGEDSIAITSSSVDSLLAIIVRGEENDKNSVAFTNLEINGVIVLLDLADEETDLFLDGISEEDKKRILAFRF